jgi:Domain of unknown function (DUF5642)
MKPAVAQFDSALQQVSGVAVQRHVNGLRDDDSDDVSIVIVTRDDRLRQRLWVPDIRDLALSDIRVADAVDDHVVSLGLQPLNRLLGVAPSGGLGRGQSRRRKRHRGDCYCHANNRMHDNSSQIVLSLAAPRLFPAISKRSLWYQRRVRLFGLFAALVLFAAACGRSPSPAPSATPSASSIQVNPARIERVRGDLPTGYEVGALLGRAAPVLFWGLGSGWSAEPPRCGALADPAADASTTRGWSASGAGGIVYAVVAETRADLDSSVAAECGAWTLSSGRTSGSVTLVAAPAVDGAATVGMSVATTTVVEGGTETHSHADSFTAYLGDYVAMITVVSDPGSPNSALGQEFAADLLVKTVSALRG